MKYLIHRSFEKFSRRGVKNVGFFDNNMIASGRTPDGREVTIVRNGSDYELRSSGSTTLRSSDLSYLERQFNSQVPNDSYHRHNSLL